MSSHHLEPLTDSLKCILNLNQYVGVKKPKLITVKKILPHNYNYFIFVCLLITLIIDQ